MKLQYLSIQKMKVFLREKIEYKLKKINGDVSNYWTNIEPSDKLKDILE